MKYVVIAAALAITGMWATESRADEPKVLTQCTTRTVDGNYSGTTWAMQQVCKENEVAVSAGGFCTQAGAMIGASTTKNQLNREVWLQCSKPGPAIWYASCCQQVAATPPPKSPKNCTTRTVNDKFAGKTFVGKDVCQANEFALSAGGFCTTAGQMVGASTTNGAQDRKVWLQCTQPGDAVWYGVCCQQ